MFLETAGLLIGFIMLIKAADALIDGAVSLAMKFHISQIAIGLTIVAFGTSAPELIVNIISAFQGHSEICYGNVVGSNMFNTLVVLGFAGLISPLLLQKDTVTKEIPFVFFGTILVALLSNNFFTGSTGLSFWDGIILVACLVIFIFYVTGIPRTAPQEGYKNLSFIKTILLIFAGVAGLFLGGEFVVRNSVIIAEQLGMSKKFISLTIVALGTSLPELVTSLIAIKKQSSDIAVGNVIGSNLFNIFMVLGVTSIIKPIAFDTALNFDLLILTAITFVLFLLVCIGKIKKLNRFEAALLLVLYGVYIYYLFQRG